MSFPYKRIVAALDGAKRSEGAIPHAVALAEGSEGELVLLSVVEPRTELVRPLVGGHDLESRRAHALAYLSGVRYRIAGRSMKVVVAVEVGAPADAVLDYARAHGVDLIVMATHGRSPGKRWLLGSVASKVVEGSAAPVLLVRVTP